MTTVAAHDREAFAEPLLTRRDLMDTLYAKAVVGLIAASMGAWLVFQPSTVPAGFAAIILGALSMAESGTAWFRLRR